MRSRHPAAFNRLRDNARSYDLGGGERLPYPEMIRRLFSAQSMSPRLVPVPKSMLYLAVLLAKGLPGYQFLRKEMVDRMYTDLIVDQSAAEQDFGYAPGGFRPGQIHAAG
jgi:hypothetical protein